MSDILIRGMEMPKNCGQCPFKKLSQTGESMICELTLFTVPWDWKTTDCPLIPVQKHGRLIDADALLESIEEARKNQPEIEDVYTEDYFMVAEWLASAPTIIPASGGQEE